jgi:hypothetical protein
MNVLITIRSSDVEVNRQLGYFIGNARTEDAVDGEGWGRGRQAPRPSITLRVRASPGAPAPSPLAATYRLRADGTLPKQLN